jgi:hypothetical protein
MTFNKKEYTKQWREKNSNYHKEYYQKDKENQKQRYQENKEDKINYQKQYYTDNKEKVQSYIKEWSEENKEELKIKFRDYMRVYQTQRKQTDPLYKLSGRIRHSIYQSLKKNRINKNNSTVEILGCTFKELKQHIESQFEPWMNWNNMGGKVITEQNINWDIDHIIPISSAKTEEDIIKLNHYTNLRPLCSYNNRFIKRDKIEMAK